MAIDPHSVSSALTAIDENRSISELVSILRTSFRVKDFDQVEEALIAKELKMRKEIEVLQSEFEFLRLDNLTQESLLKNDPKGYGKLKERENNIKVLKDLIVKVNEDREKKKSALENLEKLLEASKKTQEYDKMIIEKLKNKNLELECVMEDHRKTIEELRCKNFELECSEKELKRRKSELKHTLKVVKKTEEDDWKCIEELKSKNSKLECAKREAENNYELCKMKYDELGRRVSELEIRNNFTSGELLYKNVFGKRGAENDKIKNHADSDGDMQNRCDSSHLNSKDREKRYNEKWESEAEMRAAFDENDLLCMEAVCILYKQRGFNEADMIRGSTLAYFLTSRDSKETMNKSVMELVNFDVGGLNDCRRIAIKYLKQLFEIYKNNEYQFLFS